MTIKIRKKKTLISIILFFSLFLTISILYFIKIKVEKPYKNLFEYCTEQKSEEKKIKECHVLLSNFYKSEKGKTCFKIILPITNPSRGSLELCLKKERVIEWENPYNDYNLNIPIVMVIHYTDFPIININNIDIEVMSDEDAHELMDPINQKADKLILFRSSKATKEMEEKGFYLDTRICDILAGKKCTTFGVYRAEVVDYFLEGGALVLKVNMQILGQEKEEEIYVEEFQFEEYSYSDIEKPLKREIVDINSSLDSLISKGEIYQLEFSRKNYAEITDELIEEYSRGDINLDFVLDRVTHYVK